MTVPPFLFVRHGETDWNVDGRLQGGRDVAINIRGRRQADRAGRHLARYFARQGCPASEAVTVASPLGRARETAARLRHQLGLDPHAFATDDRLRELSFGAWEGLTWAELKAAHPQRMKERRGDKWNFVPPGGESYAMLAERVATWLDTVQERLVVVSHGGVARVLMVLVGGLSTQAAPDTAVPQGRVLRFAGRACTWL